MACQIGPNRFNIFNPFNLHGRPLTSLTALIRYADRPDAKAVSKKVVGGWDFESDYLFAVLVQVENPGRGDDGGLILWRLFDTEWTEYEQTFLHNHRILDIAYLDGLFYAFDLAGWRNGVIDPEGYGDLEMVFFSAPNILGEHINDCFSLVVDDCKYMLQEVFFVVSNERLFMVVFGTTLENPDSNSDSKPKRTVMFVYVLKEGDEIENNTWERMQGGLCDEILFIGYDASFSIPCASKNVPQWKPNSVCLFTYPFPMLFDYGEPKGLENVTFAKFWRYLNMYDPNEEENGIVPFEKLGKKKYTSLFFPPPAFVKWYCPSAGYVEVILHDLKFSKEWSFDKKSGDGSDGEVGGG